MRCFILAACSLLFLTACDKPANDNPLFPLGAGKRWTYEIETVYDNPEGKTVKQKMEFHNLGSASLADGSTTCCDAAAMAMSTGFKLLTRVWVESQ